MKFRNKDRVRVEEGFYEGTEGVVTDVQEYSGTNPKLVGTLVYTLKVVLHHTVLEEHLTLINRPKEQGEPDEGGV